MKHFKWLRTMMNWFQIKPRCWMHRRRETTVNWMWTRFHDQSHKCMERQIDQYCDQSTSINRSRMTRRKLWPRILSNPKGSWSGTYPIILKIMNYCKFCGLEGLQKMRLAARTIPIIVDYWTMLQSQAAIIWSLSEKQEKYHRRKCGARIIRWTRTRARPKNLVR